MKVKQLLAAALLFCTAGASAQTDVTSTYIQNADFSSTDGWTAVTSTQYKDYGNGLIGTYGVRTAEGQAVSTVDATHLATEYCFGFEVRWSTSYAAFTQTTSELPIGAYTLTYDVENTNSKTTKATYDNRFFVQIGDVKTTDKSTEWMAGGNSWTTHSISFNVTSPTTATISLGYGTGSNNIGSANTPTLHVSHLKLTWTDPLKAGKDALQAEIDRAKLCDAKEGLADAITAAESALTNATTADELANALATLQAADKDAVLRYDNGLADATFAAPVATSFVVNGTFTDNVDGWNRTGGFQNSAKASNQEGAFTKPFWENWNSSAKANKMYQTISNIPNGTYRLDIAAFVNTLADPNESQYVFANNDKTYLTTGAPTAYEVYTVVTNNQIEIGLEQTTATANWMGIDNVSLRYYGAGDVINDAKNASHKLAWEEAKAAAEAAVANTDYQNVTGAELTAINAEIAKDEPSTADGYDEATAALRSATSAFTSAKAAYDDLAELFENIPHLAYATSEKYVAIGDAYGMGVEVVDAADAASRAAAMRVAIRAYYESHAMAEGVEGAVNMTSSITNANDPKNNDGWTWTGNKNNPANKEPWTDADGTNTHSYFDGGNWNGTAWTTTMEQNVQIPAGKYLLTAKGRAGTNTTLTMAVGEESVELPHVGNTGNVFDRGWGDASLEFTTDGKGITIKVTATAKPVHEWFSVADFRLVQLELNEDAYAGEVEYNNLNTAIADAEAVLTYLGFDGGEYAPYNNVAALKALAAAKAIDQTAELTNFKEDVIAATEALTNATWTSNDSEVDAIFDGQFAETEANTTSGDITLPGWTKVDGIRLLVKDETVDPGLAYTDGKAAVFSWGGTTLTYGEQTGYTLPLNKHEQYEVTYKIAAWRDGAYPTKTSVTLDGVKQEKTITVPGKVNDAEGNPFLTIKFYVTPTEDNSILEIYANQHFVLADVSMKLAVAEDMVISDDAEFTQAEEKFANVTLNRSFKTGYNSVVLPFAMTAEQVAAAFGQDAKVYAYSESSEDPNNATINFNSKDENTIEANVPVLLGGVTETNQITVSSTLVKTAEAKVSGTNFDFVGTYAPTDIAAGDYFIGNGAVYKSSGATSMNAFRAYIKAKGASGEVKLFIDGGLATGIDEINGAAVENGAIYNLAGQRVNKAQKGIYIVNGKKVAVK